MSATAASDNGWSLTELTQQPLWNDVHEWSLEKSLSEKCIAIFSTKGAK